MELGSFTHNCAWPPGAVHPVLFGSHPCPSCWWSWWRPRSSSRSSLSCPSRCWSLSLTLQTWQDRAHRGLRAVLLHVVHVHDPQGGVRCDARRRPCVHHSWARLGLQVRHIMRSCRRTFLCADLLHHVLLVVRGPGVLLVHLPHHVPDVRVISLGFAFY